LPASDTLRQIATKAKVAREARYSFPLCSKILRFSTFSLLVLAGGIFSHISFFFRVSHFLRIFVVTWGNIPPNDDHDLYDEYGLAEKKNKHEWRSQFRQQFSTSAKERVGRMFSSDSIISLERVAVTAFFHIRSYYFSIPHLFSCYRLRADKWKKPAKGWGNQVVCDCSSLDFSLVGPLFFFWKARESLAPLLLLRIPKEKRVGTPRLEPKSAWIAPAASVSTHPNMEWEREASKSD